MKGTPTCRQQVLQQLSLTGRYTICPSIKRVCCEYGFSLWAKDFGTVKKIQPNCCVDVVTTYATPAVRHCESCKSASNQTQHVIKGTG